MGHDRMTWGIASSATQIESASDRGPAIWDRFAAKPGAIAAGDTPSRSCDHLAHLDTDLGLITDLGVDAYRLSFHWARLQPDGPGPLAPQALAIYDRLIDRLLAAGVEPWLTGYHWDMPCWLADQGGWCLADSQHRFAEYIAQLANHFADRIRHWIPLNEIQCFIGLGHHDGVHAPGLHLDLGQTLRAGHHAILAHGQAAAAIRAAIPAARIGWLPVPLAYAPADPTSDDDQAAARELFWGMEPIWGGRGFWNNSWWLEPPLSGHYPDQGLAFYGSDAPPPFTAEESALLAASTDFIACNLYTCTLVSRDGDGRPCAVEAGPDIERQRLMDWPVLPQCITWTARLLYERYGRPLAITENGCADHGELDDQQRCRYLAAHIDAVLAARDSGLPIEAYFAWTLLDNFEWAHGYDMPMGLVAVDFATQERRPKASYHWYRRRLAALA